VGYGLGLDIGTTFSSAAVVDEEDRVELVNLGGRAAAIPSVLLLRGDGDVLVGEGADARAAMEPTRVAREFKRRIGDPTPLVLGGTPYSAEALTTILIRHIADAVTRRKGAPPEHVVITHPASYTHYRTELLRNAAVEAGIREPALVTEPIAAATHYSARHADRVDGEVIAVYDFGGGTFDIALLRSKVDGFELVGSPTGVDRLGGIDFDHALWQHVDDHLDGALERADATDGRVVSAVMKLRRDVREAKELLSTDADAALTIILPGINEHVSVTRAMFESLIRPRLKEPFGALRRALDSAGMAMEDVSRIVLVGGSSRIPLVAREVRLQTGRPIAEDIDPEYAVALGAALCAARVGRRSAHAAGQPQNVAESAPELLDSPDHGPSRRVVEQRVGGDVERTYDLGALDRETRRFVTAEFVRRGVSYSSVDSLIRIRTEFEPLVDGVLASIHVDGRPAQPSRFKRAAQPARVRKTRSRPNPVGSPGDLDESSVDTDDEISAVGWEPAPTRRWGGKRPSRAEVLSSFFDASKRLRARPDNQRAIRDLLDTLPHARPRTPPFGIALGAWLRACALADRMADAARSGDQTALSEAAGRLHDLLEPFVAG
jgi:actin-like ATPase involved in cell morphogenesis